MASAAQCTANCANAQHSTGPRTPAGESRSAQNARQHGFTASSFAVVRLEDLDEIARLKADLISVYQPVNSQELFAVERIALAQQSLLRVARLEAGLFSAALHTAVDHVGDGVVLENYDAIAGIEITRAQNRNYAVAEGLHRMAQRSNVFALVLRYQAQTERHYRRAIEEFDRLKSLRNELPNEPISALQPEETKPPDAPSSNPVSGPEPPREQTIEHRRVEPDGGLSITSQMIDPARIPHLPKGNI